MRVKLCFVLAAIMLIASVLMGCQELQKQAADAVMSAAPYVANGIDIVRELASKKYSLDNTEYQNYRLEYAVHYQKKHLILEAIAAGATPDHFSYYSPPVEGSFASTALGDAVANSADKSMQVLIDYGMDVNHKDAQGDTYLIDCAKNCNWSLYDDVLLKSGADAGAFNEKGLSALDYIIQTGYPATVAGEGSFDNYFSHGAKATPTTVKIAMQNSDKLDLSALQMIVKQAKEQYGNTGLTPLEEAAILGDSEKLKNEAWWGIPEKDKEIVTVCAAAFANTDSLEALLNKLDVIRVANLHGSSLLDVAARYGNLENVKFLNGHYGSVNDGSLLDTVKHNHIDVVKYLLENGAKVKGDLTYPYPGTTLDELTWAAMNDNTDMANLLLRYGAPTDYDHMCLAMEGAIYADKLDMLRFLVEKNKGIIQPKDELTNLYPIEAAAYYGNVDILKYLIEQGADVNGYQNDGAPLQEASQYGGIEAVKILLENGASIIYKNDKQQDSSHIYDPIYYCDLDMLKLFVEYGADPNYDSGGTVYLAAKEGSKDMLQYLLDHGGNANAVYSGKDNEDNIKGDTALHLAVRYGWRECVQVLLAAVADTTIKNSDGKTAYDLAVEDNNQAIIQLFADAGKAQGNGSATPGAVDQAVGFAKGLIDKFTGQ